MRRVISDLALATASSCELSMARYSFRSPSGGVFPGGTYVPRTVMPASEYSLISASASCEVELRVRIDGKRLVGTMLSKAFGMVRTAFNYRFA